MPTPLVEPLRDSMKLYKCKHESRFFFKVSIQAFFSCPREPIYASILRITAKEKPDPN